jgi:hypothetical protein
MGTVRLAKWKEKRTYLALKCIKKAYIFKHKDERHINFERFFFRFARYFRLYLKDAYLCMYVIVSAYNGIVLLLIYICISL